MVPDAEVSEHLKRSARFFLIVAASPFAIGFICAWMGGGGMLLLLLSIPLFLGVLVVGGLIQIVRGVKSARRCETRREGAIAGWAAPAMMLAAFLLAWPGFGAGSFSGTWMRLIANRGHYEAIIAKVGRGQSLAPRTSVLEEDGGVEYIVDAGPPVRVAFNPVGMLDNWSGIIFDPTGEVMRAQGFDPETGAFAAPDEVTKLFDGDLVACRRLWGDYYSCTFT